MQVPNAKLEACGVKKGVQERIAESTIRLLSHIERIEKIRIAKRVNPEGFTAEKMK